MHLTEETIAQTSLISKYHVDTLHEYLIENNIPLDEYIRFCGVTNAEYEAQLWTRETCNNLAWSNGVGALLYRLQINYYRELENIITQLQNSNCVDINSMLNYLATSDNLYNDEVLSFNQKDSLCVIELKRMYSKLPSFIKYKDTKLRILDSCIDNNNIYYIGASDKDLSPVFIKDTPIKSDVIFNDNIVPTRELMSVDSAKIMLYTNMIDKHKCHFKLEITQNDNKVFIEEGEDYIDNVMQAYFQLYLK